MRIRSLALLLLASAGAGCAAAVHEPAPPGPQRPTLSSDTSTTHPGTLEYEAGVVLDDEGGVNTPVTLKYGAGSSTEIFLDWAPYVEIDGEARDEKRAADPTIGVRHRFRDEGDGSPSAAVQLKLKVPSDGDADDVSSGAPDGFAAGIVTGSLGEASWNGFYEFGALGEPEGGGVDAQHALALALGGRLYDGIGAFGELAAVLVPERDFDALFTTFGLTFAAGESILFDAGLAVGLSDDAGDLALLIGVTQNVGGPGPTRHR